MGRPRQLIEEDKKQHGNLTENWEDNLEYFNIMDDLS